MARLKTHLITSTQPGVGFYFYDNQVQLSRYVYIVYHTANQNFYVEFTEYDHTGTGTVIHQETVTQSLNNVYTFSNGDSLDVPNNIYWFADGQPNRWQTPTIQDYAPTAVAPDSNINSGVALFDKDGNPFVVADLRHINVTGGLTIDKTVHGQYTIDGSGIQPNFNDVALTGNTTAQNLSVSGTTTLGSATSSGLSVSGTTTLGTTTVSGDLTIDAIHFKQSVPTFPHDQIPLNYQYPGRPFFVTFA